MVGIVITEEIFANIKHIAARNRWSLKETLPKIISGELARCDEKAAEISDYKELEFAKPKKGVFGGEEVKSKAAWNHFLKEIILLAYRKCAGDKAKRQFKAFLLEKELLPRGKKGQPLTKPFTAGLEKAMPVEQMVISVWPLSAPYIGFLIQKISKYCGDASYEIEIEKHKKKRGI